MAIMKPRFIPFAVGTVATVAAGAIAFAYVSNHKSDDASTDILLTSLYPNTALEQYMSQIVSMMRGADREGDGLQRADVEFARASRLAQQRASSISGILRYDLNGDFKVSKDEMMQFMPGGLAGRNYGVQQQFNELDKDGDHIITIEEAAQKIFASSGNDRPEDLLGLDPNKDGTLTLVELRSVAETFFASFDKDGNGILSPKEYEPVQERKQAADKARRIAACKLPPVPNGAMLVSYGGYEGDAISSTVIGGQDMETNLINVTIEPGSKPIYLILSSYESMVWRFSGATDRLAHVVVSSSQAAPISPPASSEVAHAVGGGETARLVPFNPDERGFDQPMRVSASGVVGLPANKVTIAGKNCLPYNYKTEGAEAEAANAALTEAFGKTPDTNFGSYSAHRITVPSGAVTKATAPAPVPSGFDADVWKQAQRFWPGGLVQIDARAVVSKAKAEPYKVLPSQMGLAQLVGSGAVQHLSGDKFKIVRPIPHMPPSMGGAHSVTLILGKNISLPPGSPGHSCVLSEADMQPIIDGPMCRDYRKPTATRIREDDQRSRDIPPPPPPRGSPIREF